jgi:hypothetical protein
MVARFLVAGLMLAATCAGWCDSITVKGQAYNDVLIHTSSNFYYITLPDEGRVMTVALEDVDPATVAINNEAAYRSALKATYDANRKNPKEKSYTSLDEAQVVADAQAAVSAANDSQFDANLPAEAADGAPADGGAAGLGVSAAQLQAAVQGAGVTMAQQGMQAGHPKFFGQAASGELQIDAFGPEENLMQIVIVVTAADPGQLQASLQGLLPMIQQAAPWAPQWFTANQAALAAGSIENTQDNVHVSVIAGQSGANMSLTITLESVS